MKRFFNLFVALLLMAVLPAQAQKSVTYTFKGRAQGFLLPAKPIDLVASGSVPAGVKVSNVYVTKDAYDNDVNNEYTPGDEKINDVDMDGFLGSALLTEYVVQPSTTAHIHFDGFRYEIVGIKWSRCSEIAVLTSKGKTEARNYDNGEIGNFTFDTAGEEGYSTSGELFYHTRDFLPGYDYAANTITGLSMLQIHCTSKQAQHGIAIKNFQISYYEPVITITGNHTKLDPNSSETIGAAITAHKGAFTDAEIKFKSSNPTTATVDKDGNIHTNTDPNHVGSTVITAYIEYDGAIVSKTTYRLTVGSIERQWSFCNIFNQYNKSSNSAISGKCSLSSTQFTGLRSNNVTPLEDLEDNRCFYVYDSNYPTDGKGMMIELRKKTQTERPSLGVAKLKYQQSVPAYSSVSVVNRAKVDATGNSGKNADCRVDIVHIGTGNEWPFTNGADAKYPDTSHNYWDNKDNLNDSYVFRTSGSTASTNSVFGTRGTTGIGATGVNGLDGESNFTGTYLYSRAEEASSGVFDDYFAFSVGHEDHSLGTGTNFKLDCKLDVTTKATYTYYAYVTFNGNGADNPTAMNNPDAEAGYTSNTYLTVTASPAVDVKKLDLDKGEGLTKNTYTRDGYVFAGWDTNPAGTTVVYTDQQVFCPYNADEECGVGPVTLYAVWKKLPAPGDLDDPDVDYLVYAVFSNGGTFAGDKEHFEDVFVTGQSVSIAFPAATRSGYTLKGYYDAPEGGTMLFNASGAIQNNVTTQEYYFTPEGNWKATADVYMYAQWNQVSSPVNRTITFVPGDGATVTTNTKTVTVGESTNNNVNDLEPTKAGYKFAGWYTSASGGDMAYNANGESVVLESMSKDPVTGVNVASLLPVNEHFFNKNFRYVGNAAPFNSNFTLYAHWIPTSLAITFDEGAQGSAQSAKYALSDPTTEILMDEPAYELAEYTTVNVKRTLKTDTWNTVCLPCDVYKDQVSELFSEVKQVYSFEQVEDNISLKFKDVKVMAAGVPYFVKMKSDYATSGDAYVSGTSGDKVTQLTFRDVQVNNTPGKVTITDSESHTEVIMFGSYTTEYHIGQNTTKYPLTEQGYDYYYLQNNKFYKSGGTYTLEDQTTPKTVWGNSQGFRVYFAVKDEQGGGLSSAARYFNFLLDFDDAGILTDLEDVMDTADCTSDIYDLSGRRLSQQPAHGLYIVNGKKYIVK